jgi:hypothetical protein
LPRFFSQDNVTITSDAAILPHPATKADVADVRAGVAQLKGDMAAAISGLEAQIIKWIVATLLTSTGLAFTIAKIIH